MQEPVESLNETRVRKVLSLSSRIASLRCFRCNRLSFIETTFVCDFKQIGNPMELVLTLSLCLVLKGIFWLLNEAAEDTEPYLEQKQDLLLQKLVDEIENRACVRNA